MCMDEWYLVLCLEMQSSILLKYFIPPKLPHQMREINAKYSKFGNETINQNIKFVGHTIRHTIPYHGHTIRYIP